MSQENVVETINLVKSYGKHIALDSINLKIKGGATGLLGPNGAGKSTLFKSILGLISITSGDGIVLNHNIKTEGPIIRSKIGYMPEYDCLNPELEAIHQVAYSGELMGMNPSVAMQRAHEVLEYVGLKDQRYRALDTYSTGMKQSAKLACGLIHDPELLIADEPTNGLDTAHRDFMLNTLSQIVNQGGRSLIMASHLMNDVERVCERIVMLHKGKLIAQGKIEDLKAIEREVEVHAWGGASKLEECLVDGGLKVRRTGRVLRVVHVDDSTYDQIISAASKSQCQIRRMQDHEASLEDLFIRIMETLGYGIKSSDELLDDNPQIKHVDAPLELKKVGGV